MGVSTAYPLTQWDKLKQWGRQEGRAGDVPHSWSECTATITHSQSFGTLLPPTFDNCKTSRSTSTSHEENMFSVCGQLAGGNCTTGRMSAASTDRHVRETLNRDKLMPFYGVNLSDLRLSFPLPAHLHGKRARSRAFSWELTRTIGMANCSNVTRGDALTCGTCATFGVMKLPLSSMSEVSLQQLFPGPLYGICCQSVRLLFTGFFRTVLEKISKPGWLKRDRYRGRAHYHCCGLSASDNPA